MLIQFLLLLRTQLSQFPPSLCPLGLPTLGLATPAPVHAGPPLTNLGLLDLLLRDSPNLHDFMLPVLVASTDLVLHAIEGDRIAVPRVTVAYGEIGAKTKARPPGRPNSPVMVPTLRLLPRHGVD